MSKRILIGKSTSVGLVAGLIFAAYSYVDSTSCTSGCYREMGVWMAGVGAFTVGTFVFGIFLYARSGKFSKKLPLIIAITAVGVALVYLIAKLFYF